MRKPFNVFTECRCCRLVMLIAPIPEGEEDGFITCGGEEQAHDDTLPLCKEHKPGFDIKLVPEGALVISREMRL